MKGNGCLADVYSGDFICAFSGGLFVCDQRGLLKLNRNMTTAQIPYSNHEILSCCGACQLPFCYVYISWWILKKKKKSASTQEGEFILILLLLLATFSFETQGFFNVASCFQTVIWCVLYAHNLPSSCFHWDWLCVCVFGVREGGFFWGGKWSGLCVHRGIQSCPQSHRGSTTIPPRVLNYYHIYTFMWPLLCKICKICSVFLLLTKHLAVIFLKNTVESIVWRITPCTVHALHFSTAV